MEHTHNKQTIDEANQFFIGELKSLNPYAWILLPRWIFGLTIRRLCLLFLKPPKIIRLFLYPLYIVIGLYGLCRYGIKGIKKQIDQ